jgi:hypothetical protein
MDSYFFSQHVYFRPTRTGGVLLDLDADQYISLTPRQVTAVRHLVHGLSCESGDGTSSRSRDDELIVSAMAERRWLTQDARYANPAIAPVISTPRHSLSERWEPSPGRATSFLWPLLRAYFQTCVSLRVFGLRRTVLALSRRRPAPAPGQPVQSCTPHVAAFLHLRTYIYTERDACLLDSITLTRYLFSFGFAPMLIFGIRDDPFEAHAWVQDGDVVLNSSTQYAGSFSPILVI